MGQRGRVFSMLAIGISLVLLWAGVGWALRSSRVRSPLAWSPRVLVDRLAPFADGYGLTGLACPASNLCLAVDSRGEILRTADPAGGVQAWNGVSVGAGGPISCPSAQLCVAAGAAGLVVTSSPAGGQRAWQQVPLQGESGTGGQNAIIGVSCPSTTLCLAIDTNDRAWISTNPAGGVSAWRRERGSLAQPFDTLTGLSCPTDRFCAAIAFGGQLVTSTDPSTGGQNWHRRLIDQTAIDSGTFTTGISCPSAQLCLVVDAAGNVLSSTAPATGSWHVQALDPKHRLTGVSCPSTNLCFAFDDAGNLFVSSNPTGSAAAWSMSRPLPGRRSAVQAVLCPSSSLCVAVGYDGLESTTSDPSGGQWTGQRIDGYNSLAAVTCTTAFCAAVDDAGDVLTSGNPTQAGRGWSTVRVDPSAALTDISCPTQRLCVAVDSKGGALSSSDPTGPATAWHRVELDQNQPLTTVTCATRGGPTPVCLALAGHPIQSLPSYAADSGGGSPGGPDTIFTTDRPTGGADGWHEAILDPGGSHNDTLDTAACPSARLCVVGDASGGLLSSANPAGGPSAWREVNLRRLGAASITGISCPSPRLCVVVDNDGIVVASTNPAGGRTSWHVQVGGGFEHFAPGDVFCPSDHLCLAETVLANYSSTDPAGGKRAWHRSRGLPASPPAIACLPGTTMCVAAVGDGYIRTSG